MTSSSPISYMLRWFCLTLTTLRLCCTAGLAANEISDTDHLASIQRSDLIGGEIVTNKTTWIVVHGWNSSRLEPNISNLARAISSARPDDQVLTLDWSKLADTGHTLEAPCLAASKIVPVANWASSALHSYGFNAENLNLVGHSFGAYVVDEIAKGLHSKVRSLVALDPAANACPSSFNPVAADEVNFARDATWSWAFHSSSAGNEYVPVRAHEAFIVDSGLDTILAHSKVVDLFAYMILHQSEQLSLNFGLDDLLDDTYGPWVLDAYSSYFLSDDSVKGYEAIIIDPNGIKPSQLKFIETAPSLATSVLPRSQDSQVAFIQCQATDSGHGGEGISRVAVNGFRLPGDTALGASEVKCFAAVLLTSGTNHFEIVAADNSIKGAMTTNLLSIVYSPAAPSSLPLSQLAASAIPTGDLSVSVEGGLGATVAVEVSTDLVSWREFTRVNLKPAFGVQSSSGIVYGFLFGREIVVIPRSTIQSAPGAFYRSRLQ